VGLLLLGAGLSGQFTLLGTDSPTLLVIAGGVIAALGIFQLSKTRGT
jgi:hypothetical protein